MRGLNETAVSFYHITIARVVSYDSKVSLLTEIITVKTHLFRFSFVFLVINHSVCIIITITFF